MPYESLRHELEFKDLKNKDPFVVTHSIVGTAPEVAANYEVFFIAPFPCEVMEFAAAWRATSTSGTLTLEKLTGTQALDAGVELLTSTIGMSSNANTVTQGALVVGTARQLGRGNRLALKNGGTLTGQAGLTTTTMIKPLGKGHYQANAKSLI